MVKDLVNKELRLSTSTVESLGYYVYLLRDPDTNEIFYVGKGTGNRINHHEMGAFDKRSKETEKTDRIRDIHNRERRVKCEILRHGLTEKEAYNVECAAIDLIGIENLTNIVLGHDSEDCGIMSIDEIKIKYEVEDLVPADPVMLINVNQLFQRGMSSEQLYEITRGNWKVNTSKAKGFTYACSVYRGVTREVFLIEDWQNSPDAPGRKRFIGQIADKSIREKYRNRNVDKYWPTGFIGPIRYVVPNQ